MHSVANLDYKLGPNNYFSNLCEVDRGEGAPPTPQPHWPVH